MSFKIISCDGGGIRGLITALFIQDLDQHSQILENVDGFAGTSTGGLLALALVNGVPIEQIIKMYMTQGATIFESNGWLLAQEAASQQPPLDSALGSGPGFLSSQYKNDGLLTVAKHLLGSTPLSAAKRFVAINSARLWDGNSWMPATFSNTSSSAYPGISMVDAALATSAAPTYFPPYRVAGANYDYGFFADGGVFANNPAMTAIAEAVASGLVSSVGDIKLLSLGTGSSPQGIPPAVIGNPLKWGVSSWLHPWASGTVPAMPLLNLTMDTTAELVRIQTEQILGGNAMRANLPLGRPYALDDWKHVADLAAEATSYMKTDAWQGVRDWVSSNWS
ncbi:patatin-like phospholipase family protein [Xanthomonas sp. NCPPB 1638]|uniref:Patatin n=1 Tax=Xanthomonas cucurbitae TaxID=56453 RepID=A0A2S7DIK8_9XANT|nr:patatin-like phospholipase family protein [Xanthomonas cucurbitae]PPU73627.1 patatin [Xanthomonas cucurbitae]QHG85763.1 patatin [Xanthomonas cucurbitae]WDM75656.1 patatin-like phospholipase family protein [Xanthomonas cucurbitae]WDM79360.1 patatin-like phospholipase family protein [Xanthomonas cucurbitae]WDM83048.1 patatin-like phospholipase family protein [Xanthomonas cucurbitae]